MIYAVPQGQLVDVTKMRRKDFVLFAREKFIAALSDREQITKFLREPESKQIVDATIGWLANGWSPGRIATITGLHVELVRQIRDEHPEAIANIKAGIATQLGEVVQLLAERMLKCVNQIAPDKLPAALSQVLDKYQLMSGGVTARFETRNVATPDDLAKMFAALPSANARIIDSEQKELPN